MTVTLIILMLIILILYGIFIWLTKTTENKMSDFIESVSPIPTLPIDN